jgi:hypothetical protein
VKNPDISTFNLTGPVQVECHSRANTAPTRKHAGDAQQGVAAVKAQTRFRAASASVEILHCAEQGDPTVRLALDVSMRVGPAALALQHSQADRIGQAQSLDRSHFVRWIALRSASS